MKRRILIRSILGASLVVGAFSLPTAVTAAQTQDDCSKDILLAYFPKVFVDETLERFKVPKDQWDAINKELAEKDKDIIKIVESKASKMNPNPLKDPQQRQAAVKIFRETLFDAFASVMKAHGVTDDKQIQAMLDDVQQQKAKRFARCMESAQKQQPKAATTTPSSSPAPSVQPDMSDDED